MQHHCAPATVAYVMAERCCRHIISRIITTQLCREWANLFVEQKLCRSENTPVSNFLSASLGQGYGLHREQPCFAPLCTTKVCNVVILSGIIIETAHTIMKLTAIAIYKWVSGETQPVLLGISADVANFGYFQRSSIREMISFTSRTIVQRTQPGQRQTVKQDDYFCHVHVRDTRLAGVVVADKEYPTTAAFAIVSKILEEYLQQHGDSWQSIDTDNTSSSPLLDQAVTKYQDPTAADKISKIQKDLDETKIILHQTIDSVLQRGEKLDALVDKSADLGLASQMFYKQARKTNSCCTFM